MNQVASSAAASPDAIGAQARPSGTAAWAWRIGVYAGSTLFAIVWSFFAGKDLNWDALNYHLYSGYSVAHDRFGTDFLAAGPQSYFSPYAHVPLYAMVMAHWPSLTIGTVLAAAHSINLWLTYELALRVVPRRAFRPAYGVAVFAVILAALNPVLLQTMGSSYVDITTGAVALAGWVVLAAMFERPTTKGMVLAGVLLGVATALKMSNAVFAIAGVAVVLCLPGALSARLRLAAIYGLACALAFGATYGAWGLRLWQEFHNPFFPFFNGLFGSPEFTTEPLKQTRCGGPSRWLSRCRWFMWNRSRPMCATSSGCWSRAWHWWSRCGPAWVSPRPPAARPRIRLGRSRHERRCSASPSDFWSPGRSGWSFPATAATSCPWAASWACSSLRRCAGCCRESAWCSRQWRWRWSRRRPG
jgi:hypothetical protein